MLASLRPALGLVPRSRSHVALRYVSSTASPKNDAQTVQDLPKGMTKDELVTQMMNQIPDNPQLADSFRASKKWRIFENGHIVTPKDLTPVKCASATRRPRRSVIPPPSPVTRYKDVFRYFGVDPLDFSLNPSLLSYYLSELGKIYPRNITGLTARSQRRLGKAIRRARMIGILPQLSRPPSTYVKPHMHRSN